MVKHIDLDDTIKKEVMEYKRRVRTPGLLTAVREALESIVKHNGHVSYVERMPVAQIKHFYTLWDDEIVGQFYINFHNESLVFLHDEHEYKIVWDEDDAKNEKYVVMKFVEAYATDNEAFEELIKKMDS